MIRFDRAENSIVIAGLDPAIHAFLSLINKDMDARVKREHDE
jgi:hypothetical protein